jgi:hypothetical protein
VDRLPVEGRRREYPELATEELANSGSPRYTAHSIHFHCWQPDTFLDIFVAAREEVGLDFKVVAFAPPETEDDLEFIVILAKGRFGGIRTPGKPPSRLRELVLSTRLGPPLGSLWRAVKRAGK